MKILLSGANGYIGFPLALKLEKAGHFVIAVDNNSREEWVKRIIGKSTEPDAAYYLKTIIGSLTDKEFVDELLKIHKPDVIIHCASQPSMPYSQISWDRALFTQLNNLSMNVNFLWGLKENNLLNTKYIVLTTTGIPGQFYSSVPEGDTLNKAGSWYHISRGFDSENCNLAARQWGLQTVEFRTSIVYGITTEELKEVNMKTRFDTDEYFGTALNRFIAQAINKKPITIYGKGEQKKPFISLEDCCQSIVNSIDANLIEKHTILNQTTECVSIATLAGLVAKEFGVETIHIPNPRKEKEDFKMDFNSEKFMKLLGEPRQLIADGIKEMAFELRK